MHGKPALPDDFTHFPYANPEAPQGGTMVFAETGGFDNLNPYILKGSAPWGVRVHMAESLMARSWDEPFALYGLLAERIETPQDRSWVEFTLNPAARFSDGSPVTVDDVIWSMEIMAAEGHPRYQNSWAKIASAEETAPGTVRFTFNTADRELPLILGLRPILKKADWEGRAFAESTLEPFVTSGPYTIEGFEPNRQITFVRDPDYWGNDLPARKGLMNFEKIRYDYFRNAEARWEAVRGGQVSVFHDTDPVRWVSGYDFPAVTDGRLVRTEITHSRPTGMEGFVLNTRRAPFDDRRVRRALLLSFDWGWVNETLYRGAYERIGRYWDNSPLGAVDIPADADWAMPPADTSGRNRRGLRAATALLAEAGWSVADGVLMRDGVPLSFEILVGSTEHEKLASIWTEGLARLGITATVRRVDSAQYRERRNGYDYDVTVNKWWLSLSPGNEQTLYFGSGGRETPGTRNYMGVADPAIDKAIDRLVTAVDDDAFRAAVRDLDTALSSGLYVIPLGYLPTDRVAHLSSVAKPDQSALYGWRPEVWWQK